MKKNFAFLTLIGALALGSLNAHAYSSNAGADPKNGTPDMETKQVVKHTVAGESAAISKGHILSYASALDGYTVSRVGNSGVGADQNRAVCVAYEAIATGDFGYHDCVTKGFVDFLKYDATLPITAFHNLCVNTEGVAVACAASGGATRNTGIMALESKASGTGTMKAIINLR